MKLESKLNKRAQFRVPVQRGAFVTYGTRTSTCVVHDLTDAGLEFHADLSLNIDDTIRMEVQLDGDCIIHCELRVVHMNRPHFGGRITRISPADHQQLVSYIERLIQSIMTRV